jgi:hypothetical protein
LSSPRLATLKDRPQRLALVLSRSPHRRNLIAKTSSLNLKDWNDPMLSELAQGPDVTIAAPTALPILPAVIADAGGNASKRYIEFLTATISNANNRQAYARAIGDFFAWCHRNSLALTAIGRADAAWLLRTRVASLHADEPYRSSPCAPAG